MNNIKQPHHNSQHSPTAFSKYTLLHCNPLLKYIYTHSPISNYLPKHIILFTTSFLPSITCVLFNSITSASLYSLITSSITLSLLLLLLTFFVVIHNKTKSISFITRNPKINFCFYTTIYLAFSVGLIALRNAVKSTLLRNYVQLQIDFIYINVELLYTLQWLCCGYCEYIYMLMINVVIFVLQIPFICVDVKINAVTVCSIVVVHGVGVTMSYVVTLLKKKLFVYEGSYCGSKDDLGDVVDELGLGVVTVGVRGKHGRRDVKWNAVFNGKDALRELIGEKGEYVERLFTEIKDVNEDIEWNGFGKDNNGHKRRCEGSNNVNNGCNSYHSNRCSVNGGNCSNNNTTIRQLNSQSKQVIMFNNNNTNNNNVSVASSTNPTHLYLLNHKNLLPSKTFLPRPSVLSIRANPFTAFLYSLVEYEPSSLITPLCTCIIPHHASTSSSSSTLFKSPIQFLYLKTYYFYNPLKQHIKFIFVDESQTQYETAFKTYIQQISMYLHDFKNPLVTIEEKVKQIKDIITYIFHESTNPNTSIPSNELESELHSDINFVSHTASDCVCMVRSYENFAKRIISNNADEAEQIDLVLFPLKDVYDYLTEWMNMKLELNGGAVQFELRLGEGVTPHFMLCTDKMKLKQILINILSNSIKFTQEGTITLAITRVVSGGRKYTKFCVEDTGSGMNKAMKESLFKPFVSNNKVKNNKYGCGLGMVISMQNSKVIGKEIQVESVEGKGTMMWFYVEEKEAPQSRLSTFNVINDNDIEGIRRVFKDEEGSKVKKANTLFHNVFAVRNVKRNSHQLQQQQQQQLHTAEKSVHVLKSKTLPSTLASSEFNAVAKVTVHENEYKHIESLSMNATELFNDPIQILPNHKSMCDTMTSTLTHNNVVHSIRSQKLRKPGTLIYKFDKSKTTKCSFILTKQNTITHNNNISNINNIMLNSNDIIPCSLNFNNLQNIPVSKTTQSPMMPFYKKNSLMSPCNAFALRNNNNNNVNSSNSRFNNVNSYCNSNSVSHNKTRPQLDIVRTSSSSYVAIKNVPALEQFTVLLCDDDESIQHAHMRMLNERNINRVDKVSDGVDLVKMFLNNELNVYDLILVDYSMCYMDGTDAVKVIRFMRDNAIGERCNFNYDVLKRITFATGAMDVVKDVLNDKDGEFKYYNKPINKKDLKKILKDCGVIK